MGTNAATLLTILALLAIAALIDDFQKGRLKTGNVRRYLCWVLLGLLVLLIIGMIGANYVGKAIDKLKVSAARGEMSVFEDALRQYRNDVSAKRYPLNLQQLVTDNAVGWAGPYTATITPDPWENQYQYQSDDNACTITSVHRAFGFRWSSDSVTITHVVAADTPSAAATLGANR